MGMDEHHRVARAGVKGGQPPLTASATLSLAKQSGLGASTEPARLPIRLMTLPVCYASKRQDIHIGL